MPQLGETVSDGTVTKWFKAVGEDVVRGESLFEVSTDKVDTEIPAPASGILTSVLVQEGETVDVGTVLAVIGGDPAATNAPTPRTPSPTTVKAERASASSPKSLTNDEAQQLSPVVRRLLKEHGLEASQITGTGANGRLTRDDVLDYVASPAAKDARTLSPGPTSPVVRRLLEEGHVHVTSVVGTGKDGRVTRHDAEAALMSKSATTRNANDEVVPFTNVRKRTAEHMVRSKATSAHTLMVKEIDYEVVDAVRRRFGASFKKEEGFSLTYLPFSAMATMVALGEFPRLNASVGEDELIIHHDVNLGIAVDLDGEGLVVPVVRGADELGLRELARQIRGVADAARAKKLTVDDMAGATFTITNPGPFHTLLTGAIINQPQVAILSTDGVARKPVVVAANGVESIAIHSMGLLALTFDHRAIDGAYAARFLARVAEIMMNRDWAQEL
jgi:2-oxoglutarate dehydrogenase E2 component (dihydrolipoamide succinyltransferase)